MLKILIAPKMATGSTAGPTAYRGQLGCASSVHRTQAPRSVRQYLRAMR
jgi:hypothetical protein